MSFSLLFKIDSAESGKLSISCSASFSAIRPDDTEHDAKHKRKKYSIFRIL